MLRPDRLVYTLELAEMYVLTEQAAPPKRRATLAAIFGTAYAVGEVQTHAERALFHRVMEEANGWEKEPSWAVITPRYNKEANDEPGAKEIKLKLPSHLAKFYKTCRAAGEGKKVAAQFAEELAEAAELAKQTQVALPASRRDEGLGA